jgi:hypothetical protein
VLRRHLRRHMREVHDFVADLVRRGQDEGVIAANRDPDAEAWIMLAGGILGMVGRRVGLLDDDELQAARVSWFERCLIFLGDSWPDSSTSGAQPSRVGVLSQRSGQWSGPGCAPGLLHERASRLDLRGGSAAHPPSSPLPGAPGAPPITVAWRPACTKVRSL